MKKITLLLITMSILSTQALLTESVYAGPKEKTLAGGNGGATGRPN